MRTIKIFTILVVALFFFGGEIHAQMANAPAIEKGGATGVYIDEVKVIFGKEPNKVTVQVQGNLANPCVHIERVEQTRTGNLFKIRFVLQEKAGACIQVLAPFEKDILLNMDGLAPGRYQVDGNGVVVIFDWPQKN